MAWALGMHQLKFYKVLRMKAQISMGEEGFRKGAQFWNILKASNGLRNFFKDIKWCFLEHLDELPAS